MNTSITLSIGVLIIGIIAFLLLKSIAKALGTICIIGVIVAASYFYCPFVKEKFGTQIEKAGKTITTIDQNKIDGMLDQKVDLPSVNEVIGKSKQAIKDARSALGEK